MVTKNNLSDTKSISLSLDKYNDIFSDFDSRPYTIRTISDDFIEELKKVDPERLYLSYHLIFTIPSSVRNIKDENLIKSRLNDFFTNQYLLYATKKKKILQRGFLFLGLGIFSMVIALFLVPMWFTLINSSSNFITIMFEFVSWFFLWSGLDIFISDYRETNKPSMFYNKLRSSRVSFISENKV